MANIITVGNLSSQFDTSNSTDGIKVKLGKGLAQLPDGTIITENNNVIYADSGITVHNAAADVKTSVVNTNVTIIDDGDYMLTLSFNYNIDSTNSFGKWYSTFNGNALDLNDRNADPQGQYQIMTTRVRNSGSTNGGNITGTGSGNKFPYQMQFLIVGLTAGTYPFTLDCSNQSANINTSTWNIIAKFEIL